MKTINNAEIISVNLVAEEPNPEAGVYAVHIVRADGWRCVQTDCDGEHHFYVKP